jgi:hypothetical protein
MLFLRVLFHCGHLVHILEHVGLLLIHLRICRHHRRSSSAGPFRFAHRPAVVHKAVIVVRLLCDGGAAAVRETRLWIHLRAHRDEGRI